MGHDEQIERAAKWMGWNIDGLNIWEGGGDGDEQIFSAFNSFNPHTSLDDMALIEAKIDIKCELEQIEQYKNTILSYALEKAREWASCVRWVDMSMEFREFAMKLKVDFYSATAPASIRWKAFNQMMDEGEMEGK